jgi:diadenylate cyclase
MEFWSQIYDKYIVGVLDIVILYILFYRAVLIIKGTKTIQILAGILFFLGLTVVARDVLHLNAVTSILEYIWVSSGVLLVVVFQTEIRNFLAQLGHQFFNSKKRVVKDKFILEISAAVDELSSSKYGALIVIENEIGLRNFTETGVELDAKISKELLLSIFKNKFVPLHDGAVVIINNRIAVAGCVLPLSANTNIKFYGTRHRAALGISESVDAIVVVVSEETGQISLAYKGTLNANISCAKLVEFMKKYGANGDRNADEV